MATIDQILVQLAPAWTAAGPRANKTSSCRLLRLALLRDFTRQIHTLRSECMSAERPETGEDLSRRENGLNALFQSLALETLTLEEVYQRAATATEALDSHTSTRLHAQEPSLDLPAGLLKQVELSKFTRQDRRWEAEIAQEAHRQGWHFWQFEASVEIHAVERFARIFSERLWPHGIVLFVESDGFVKMSEKSPGTAYWRGRWLTVVDSDPQDKFTPPEWPHSEPQWTEL